MMIELECLVRTNGSFENGPSSGFSNAVMRAFNSWIVSSFVAFFGRGLTLIPTFCFAALVITGAAGCASLFLRRVVATMAEYERDRE